MLFELDHVTARRGQLTVLRDVSAAFERGATCVAGPSGSGKSTLLRLLNRLADPAAGRVLYRGEDVRSRDVLALRRDVCLVPQLPALVEGTVADNVCLGPRLARRPCEPGPALELSGLPASFAERDARRLSVGEQQRVMLARALVLEPSVLLLDEPTTALDEATRDSVEATLNGLRERLGLSWVLVTHDPEQARRMAETVVQLADGRLVGGGVAA